MAYSAESPTPYRPSNGTEGYVFMGQWCAYCAMNRVDDDACDIQLRALAHNTDEGEYPAEWVSRNGKPVCTAFRDAQDEKGEPVAPRCLLTPDIFGEGSGC